MGRRDQEGEKGEAKEHAARFLRIGIARIGEELHVGSPRMRRSEGHRGIKTLAGETGGDREIARAIMVASL